MLLSAPSHLPVAPNDLIRCCDLSSLDTTLHPAKWNIIFRAMWRYLPTALLDLVDYIPTKEYTRFRRTTKIINKVSKQLIDEKTDALLAGDMTGKDAMSILGACNSLQRVYLV